ncbi:MAG: T9SS type A sorting domain-containing protein [Syntrophothermus sp.]
MKSFSTYILCILSLLILADSSSVAQVTVTATAGTITNKSYAKLSLAFTAINNGDHQGTITINIAGNITETSTASLMYSGSGSASYTSILIQPSGGAARTISGQVDGNAMIKLNGADNVTINGLNTGGNSLTISNTSVSSNNSTCTINFVNGATNNTVTNCTVLGSFSGDVNRETGSTTKGGTIYFAADAVTTNGNDNNTISSCNIGPAGANLPTAAIFGYGSTTTLAIENSGNTISNNNIYDFFRSNIPSSGVYSSDGCNSWTITGNRFYQTAARTFTASATALHRVITIQPQTHTACAPATTITNNIIGYASASQTGVYNLSGASGLFTGIYYYPARAWAAADISGNTIASVSLTGVTSANIGSISPFSGIMINGSPANTNNNTIGSQTETGSIHFATNTASAVNIYGIYNWCTNTTDYTANGNAIGGITVENAQSTSSTFSFCGIKEASVCTTFTAESNIIGGTAANSIQNNSTSISAQVIGISHIMANCSVSYNTVRNMTCAGGTKGNYMASMIGILIYPSASFATSHSVTGNLVHSLSNTGGSGATIVFGILCYAPSGAITYNIMMDKNLIHSLSGVSTDGEVNGIRVQNSAPGASTTAANNMVSLGLNPSGAAITSGVKLYGINDNGGTNSFYFNSVLIGGTGVTGSNATYALCSNNNSTRNFQNNILINSRSNAAGGTGKHYAVSYSGLNFNLLTSDYNDLYTCGTGGVLGYYSSDRTSLDLWKSGTGKDSHSKSFDVSFTSAADLHLTGASAGNHNFDGIPIAGITSDFDGEVRNEAIPYIGADEVISTPLPVELASFSAALSGTSVILKWCTATEVSNYGFDVERTSGIEGNAEWTKIGFVKGHGNSNSPVIYVFTDNHPLNSKNIYRLKQIDTDGKYKFYDAVSAEVSFSGKVSLAQNVPNPFNPATSIKFQIPFSTGVTIKIYDLLGREIATLMNEEKAAGSYIAYWNGRDSYGQNASSGVYFYKLTAGSSSETRKMNLLR